MDSHGKYDRGRSPSRSPERGSGWVDRSKSFHSAMMEGGSSDHDKTRSLNRERSRSHSRSPSRQGWGPPARGHSPVYSFHRSMMARGGSSPQRQRRSSPPSPDGGRLDNNSRHDWGKSHSSYKGEEEEGMIPDNGTY